MNKWIASGRLTRDPEVRYGGANNTCVARFSLAVDRRYKKDNQPTADFFNCVAFGKTGEFVDKYLKKGTKVIVEGEVQNDNYKDKDGVMRYGTSVAIGSIEFAESKRAAAENKQDDEYMQTNTDIADDEIPFR
jgi:single-strand DNA-binding protein